MSTTLWDVAEELGVTPLIWPTIPFYSHKKGKLMSRRNVTEDELTEYRWFLDRIVELYQPKKILAIGRKAEEALKLLGIKAYYVKHPRSGKKAFKNRIASLMN